MFRRICAVSVAAIIALAPLPAFAVSLTEALAQAYVKNPQIASALLSVKIAAEDIALRKAGKRPSISLSGSSGYSWTISGGSLVESGSGSLSLSYSQRLFDNLKTEHQISQAAALADAAAQGLRNAEQNVLLQAATAYMDVVSNTRLTQLRAENVTFLQAQVQSAQDRLRVGEGTRIDVSQAEARYAQAVASYRTAVSNLQASQASYKRWIGAEPSGLNTNFRFGSILPASLDEAMRSADANHPANLSARAQIAAAQAGSDAAYSAFGPTLDLVGSVGASASTGMELTPSASIRFTLSIPIYSGGAIGAAARQASLREVQSEVDALNTRGQIQEAVIAAYTGVQTADSQITAASQAVSAAEIALDGVIAERDVGQRTTLDVLNARAELTAAQEAEILAQRGKIVASFSLVAAAGNLSAANLNLPVQIRSADGYRATVEQIWREVDSLAYN